MKLSEVLNQMFPEAQFTIVNNDYTTLDWHSADIPVPTLEAVAAFYTSTNYRALRLAEYPSIGDQLDAIMKGGQALADMQATCMAVKAKYPKGA